MGLKIPSFKGIKTGVSPLLMDVNGAVNAENLRLNNPFGAMNNEIGMEKWAKAGAGKPIVAIHQLRSKRISFVAGGGTAYDEGFYLDEMVYEEPVASYTFYPQGAGSKRWGSIHEDPFGNIYAGVYNGKVYKQTSGIGSFTLQSGGPTGVNKLASNGDGDIFCCGSDIWKQTAGNGSFVNITNLYKNFEDVCVTPSGSIYGCGYQWIYSIKSGIVNAIINSPDNGPFYHIDSSLSNDVYACVNGDEILKQTNETGSFISESPYGKDWSDIKRELDGSIYACERTTKQLWKKTNGVGDFTPIELGGKTPQSFCVTPSGDIFFCVYGGAIYRKINGVGDIVDVGAGNKNWEYMYATKTNDVYACVYNGDIYKAAPQ